VDGMDEAAQLELYSVADRQPMQLDQGRRDMVGATQAEHQSGSCILTFYYAKFLMHAKIKSTEL